MDFKWTVTTQATDLSIPVDSSDGTLHSVCQDGKYSKLSALQMGQRKLKPSAAARARALLSLYLREATGGWREIRGYDYSIWKANELSQKKNKNEGDP